MVWYSKVERFSMSTHICEQGYPCRDAKTGISDKHTSLLHYIINYNRKKFYSSGTVLYFFRNLTMDSLS